MNAIPPIVGPGVVGTDPMIFRIGMPGSPPMVQGAGFAEVLNAGVRHVETKLAQADDLVRRFALNDSVPLHQVTYALEEARMAVELAMQVRGKLVDGYREIMNMQL